MSDFTQGKWEATSGGSVIVADQKWYLPCGFDNNDELYANAKLIAAAPEMYDLLQRLAYYDPDVRELIDYIDDLTA